MDLLTNLGTFVAVARARSFTGAADELGVPQPVLSRRVGALENELRGRLFDRSRRQIEVTDFGLMLLPLATDLLGRAEALVAAAREHEGIVTPTLGVPPQSDAHALADLVGVATTTGVSLTVRELASAARDAALANGELSIAVVRVPHDMARVVVPIGLAGRADAVGRPGTAAHLSDYRARRAAPGSAVTVLITEEDQFGGFLDQLSANAARAGLAPAQIGTTRSASEAIVEVLAGHAVMVCAEPVAREAGLDWRPLRENQLARGYDLRTGPAVQVDTAHMLVRLLRPALARCLGGIDQRVVASSAINYPSASGAGDA